MFDINDPYSWLNQPVVPQQRTKLNLLPLSQQEEEGVLGQIGGKLMGGLGYLGSTLDKTFGGRAIRAGLHGLTGGNIDPTELLSFVPFSDTLGLTDEKNRVGGKLLLGLSGDDWGSTLAGMGAEMALDPAMYLSFGTGALTKPQAIARGVAKDAGMLPSTFKGTLGETLNSLSAAHTAAGPTPAMARMGEALASTGKTLAELGDQPLGAIAGLGLPFAEPAVQFGTGAGGKAFLDTLGRGAQLADQTLSSLPFVGHGYETARNAVEATGRYAGGLFNTANRGMFGKTSQEAAKEATEIERVGKVVAEKNKLRWTEEAKAAGLSNDDIRSFIEGTYQGTPSPDLARIGGEIKSARYAYLSRAQRLGIDLPELNDPYIEFAPRQMTPVQVPTKGYEQGGGLGQRVNPLSPYDPRNTGREEILKGLPGGTVHGVNPMSVDPMVSGPHRLAVNDLGAAEHIRQQYMGWTPQMEHELYTLRVSRNQLTDPVLIRRLDELEAADKHSMKLADYMHTMDPARNIVQDVGPTRGQPLFDFHALSDFGNYQQRMEKSLANAETLQNTLAREAVTAPNQPGFVSLPSALEQLGLTSGQGGQELVQRLMAQGKQGAASVADLAHYHVPQDVVNDLVRGIRGFQAPDILKPALGGFDWLTQLNKAYQTMLWPAFHVRNLLSGQAMNASRAGLGSVLEAPGAAAAMAGREVPGASRIGGMAGLSNADATRALMREAAAYQPLQAHGNVGQGMLYRGGEKNARTLDELLSVIPGEQPASLSGALGKLRTGDWTNPLDIQNFAPLQAGQEVGNLAEGTNRLTMFNSLRKQGFSEGEAARRSIASHFDYGDRTGFEREVMARLIPFYTYSRKNVPHMMQALMEHPGGLEGMTARAGYDLRQQEGFLPPNVGQGLAVPFGEEQGGHRKYLTKTDVPIEQAAELLRGGPHAIQGTMASLLSQMNPMVKGPLEYAMGKNLYSGHDVDPPLLSSLAANLPTSRFVSTAHTLANPASWQDPYTLPLGLSTGLKINDVDLERMRQTAGRDAIQELLRGQPEIGKYEQIFVRPGQESQLSPDEIMLLRLNRTLEQQALARARSGR